MTFDAPPTHVTYSPIVLLGVSVAVSLLVALVVAVLLRAPGRTRVILITILASPLPLLLLAREHLPILSGSPLPGVDFCFGEPGFLHLVSFLLPPFVGLLTLTALRARNAEARA